MTVRGEGLKPLLSRNAPLTQQVEYETFNFGVAGSIPARRTRHTAFSQAIRTGPGFFRGRGGTTAVSRSAQACRRADGRQTHIQDMESEFSRFIRQVEKRSFFHKVFIRFALLVDYEGVYDRWVYTVVRRICVIGETR